MGELLTPDGICNYVPDTTKGYWATLRYEGRGPQYIRISPKKIFYDKNVVDAWLQASVQTQTSDPVPGR